MFALQVGLSLVRFAVYEGDSLVVAISGVKGERARSARRLRWLGIPTGVEPAGGGSEVQRGYIQGHVLLRWQRHATPERESDRYAGQGAREQEDELLHETPPGRRLGGRTASTVGPAGQETVRGGEGLPYRKRRR